MTAPLLAPPDGPAAGGAGAGLVVDGVTVAFGGLVALDDVSLVARTGRVTGLIGPNGAGKTTLFNVISGVQRAGRGRVELLGRDITHWRPHRRAAAGLGRTFQRMELFWTMTVAETVRLAVDAAAANRRTGRNRFRRADDAGAERTAELLELCGLTALADVTAAQLSTGQARVLELARAIATRPAVLLLDEPSSGLDTVETKRFAAILDRVLRLGDIALVLVEHDVDLVFAVCQDIYVLEFGRIIATGDPGAIQADDLVRTAYLGEGIV
ncbi:MAG TPA: ABC transporter ATP-binding protein [Acidimicrobiia bacterium]|nr:ABC transporter ATP-binding protein [Acidimicrobiia bacterium]